MTEKATESRTGNPGRLVSDFSSLVTLPHTAFALPFALTAVVLASYEIRLEFVSLVLVVAAVILIVDGWQAIQRSREVRPPKPA